MMAGLLQCVGLAGRVVRQAVATGEAHAGVYAAVGDGAPDPVGDAQLKLHDQVAQVVREPRPAPGELRHPEDRPVVPLDLRVRVHPARQSPERNTHAVTMTGPPAWIHSLWPPELVRAALCVFRKVMAGAGTGAPSPMGGSQASPAPGESVLPTRSQTFSRAGQPRQFSR